MEETELASMPSSSSLPSPKEVMTSLQEAPPLASLPVTSAETEPRRASSSSAGSAKKGASDGLTDVEVVMTVTPPEIEDADSKTAKPSPPETAPSPTSAKPPSTSSASGEPPEKAAVSSAPGSSASSSSAAATSSSSSSKAVTLLPPADSSSPGNNHKSPEPPSPLSMTTTTKKKKKQEKKRWAAVEEAESKKGFVISLKRMMGCGSSLDAMYDDPMPVVVFGATGLVGGAVARALLRDRRFEVKAVTRTPTTDLARKLAEEGAIIVTADLNDARSVTRAIGGAHAVFLVTHYWEHMSKDKEIQQGKNCIDAAVSSGIGHLVFYGSESPRESCSVECNYMDAKAAIEEYARNSPVPYTALRLPFYFENFLSVFKPHKVRPGVYAVAIPMEDNPMDCISVNDVGRCVVNVLLRPRFHMCSVLPVTAEKLTVQQITDTFNKHFNDRKFICPKIRVKDYERFDFKGAKDIAAMFQYYQDGQEPHDVKSTRKLSSSLCSFDRWVADNKQKLIEAMDEQD